MLTMVSASAPQPMAAPAGQQHKRGAGQTAQTWENQRGACRSTTNWRTLYQQPYVHVQSIAAAATPKQTHTPCTHPAAPSPSHRALISAAAAEAGQHSRVRQCVPAITATKAQSASLTCQQQLGQCRLQWELHHVAPSGRQGTSVVQRTQHLQQKRRHTEYSTAQQLSICWMHRWGPHTFLPAQPCAACSRTLTIWHPVGLNNPPSLAHSTQHTPAQHTAHPSIPLTAGACC